MSFYWSEKSIPELRCLPREVRERVISRAFNTLPVTFWSGLFVVGFMVVGITVSVTVGITLGLAIGLLLAEAQCLVVKPLLLNLARPRFRELLEDR